MGVVIKSAEDYRTKYSYSKVDVFHKCPRRFKLVYRDGHYIQSDTLAIELGTLVHWIEEHIGLAIKEGRPIDYEKLKDDFLNINIPKKSPTDKEGGIYGINILKEKFREDYYKVGDNGVSYNVLCQQYLESGIYRLENFLKENPDWEIYGLEQYFSVDYYCATTKKHYILYGYIDRILHNKKTDEYQIQDIKTRSKFFPEDDVKSPLQFFFYSYALKSMLQLGMAPRNVLYDLPFMGEQQVAGSRGWYERCMKILDTILEKIENKKFKPEPGPLCYYCPFSGTNPEKDKLQQKDKYLCPYYSLWRRKGDPTWKVAYAWEGEDRDAEILVEFQRQAKAMDFSDIEIEF